VPDVQTAIGEANSLVYSRLATPARCQDPDDTWKRCLLSHFPYGLAIPDCAGIVMHWVRNMPSGLGKLIRTLASTRSMVIDSQGSFARDRDLLPRPVIQPSADDISCGARRPPIGNNARKGAKLWFMLLVLLLNLEYEQSEARYPGPVGASY
jgi:hypothetical protein